MVLTRLMVPFRLDYPEPEMKEVANNFEKRFDFVVKAESRNYNNIPSLYIDLPESYDKQSIISKLVDYDFRSGWRLNFRDMQRGESEETPEERLPSYKTFEIIEEVELDDDYNERVSTSKPEPKPVVSEEKQESKGPQRPISMWVRKDKSGISKEGKERLEADMIVKEVGKREREREIGLREKPQVDLEERERIIEERRVGQESREREKEGDILQQTEFPRTRKKMTVFRVDRE